MFEAVSDGELVDFMGEETREESAAMGRRLAAVGELFARRERDYQEAKFYFTDVVAAVAAEIAPIQNISH
ncbi:HNH endonuclease, partial [Mycolicibacterium sp. XJ662]